jgi:GNAT superfamily N-acetyltransferase
MILRPATPSDIPEMLAFIRELAEYERAPGSAITTEADLLRDGFGPTPRFHCLIAEWSEPARTNNEQRATNNEQRATNNEQRTTNNEPRATNNEQRTGSNGAAGFVLYFYNYSTWRGRAGITIEDLFVRPAFRRRGIGKALFARVAAIAVAEGCPRLEWAVLNWNTPAIDFYRSLGAEPLSEWTTMRVSEEALAGLGSEAAGG